MAFDPELSEEDVIQVEQVDKGIVARILESEVTMFSLPEIRSVLMEIVQKKPPFLILDFARSDYMDSSSIALIFKIQNEILGYQGRFCVTALKPSLKKVLGAVVREDEMAFFETVEEAMQSVTG